MHGWYGDLRCLVLVFLLCLTLAAGGCEGTDTRDKVDGTVEELVGKKDMERYQKMKDDLGEMQDQQTEKYRQLDQAVDDK